MAFKEEHHQLLMGKHELRTFQVKFATCTSVLDGTANASACHTPSNFGGKQAFSGMP